MRRPYAWEGALIVFFFLLLLLGVNIIFGLFQSLFEEPLALSPVLIIGELLILGLVLLWAAVRGLPWQETFYLYKTSWSMIGLSVLLAVAWWFVATALATLIEQLVSRIGPPPEIPPPRHQLDAIGYLVAIIILAPICEEPVFRGLVMRGWLRYGFVAGVAGSGILFGLQHAQITAAIPISIVGVVLGIVTFRAGSLLPAVVTHAVYNGLGAPFLVFPEKMPEISDLTLVIAGGVALPFALFVVWLYHRLAPAFDPPEREPLEPGRLLALVLSLLLVLGLFLVLVSLEVFIRLNPQLPAL